MPRAHVCECVCTREFFAELWTNELLIAVIIIILPTPGLGRASVIYSYDANRRPKLNHRREFQKKRSKLKLIDAALFLTFAADTTA